MPRLPLNVTANHINDCGGNWTDPGNQEKVSERCESVKYRSCGWIRCSVDEIDLWIRKKSKNTPLAKRVVNRPLYLRSCPC